MKSYFQTTILMLALLLPATAQAHDFEVNGIYYRINGNEVAVTFCGSSYNEIANEYYGDVTIPESVTYNGVTYAVTSIANAAFAYCDALNRVTIGNAVTTIGKNAFFHCDNMSYINVSNSVISIADQAFTYCGSLSSVNIPKSVTSIGKNAFYGCYGLTSVNITDITAWLNIPFTGSYDNPLMFARRLFLNGIEVTDLTIPNSVTSIGNYSFYGCNSLINLTLGSSVTSIGYNAFGYCTSLKSVTIGKSVTSIDEIAFYGCSSMKTITVDSGNPVLDSRGNCNAIIVSASNELFLGCQNTRIPNSVTAIGSYAFVQCSGLTNLTIPNSVTSIGYDAFYGCSGLVSLMIPKSVIDIKNNPFAGCTSLASIVVESGNPVYDSRGNCNALIETASNTLVSGCKNTHVPNTVTTIGSAAFNECSGLTTIEIPNSVTAIEEWAFCDCSGLTNIRIPSTISTLGDLTFYGCSSLTYFKIPNSVISVGESVFYGCSAMSKVVIGNSVTSIGGFAFSGCNALTDIECYAKNPPQIEDYTFDDYCYNNARLGVPAMCIDAYRNAEKWWYFNEIYPLSNDDLFVDGIYYRIEDDYAVVISSPSENRYAGELVIPSTIVHEGITYPVTVIGEMAFYDCPELTNVTIPNSVTTIGRESFEYSGLTNIVIPASVTFIDEYPFIECEALQSMTVEDGNPVYDSRDNCNAIIETASNTLLFGCQKTVIPNTVTAIGDAALYYCTTLKSIVIPNSVITIGEDAFYGCSGMKRVTIGNSVTTISEEAFESCSSLTSVVIPNSVKYIGFEAFSYCYDLKEVTIGKSVTTMENGAFYCCEALTDVYCHIADPTNVIKLEEEDDECEVFYSDYGKYAQRTLHVPAGTLAQYSSSEYWYPFFGQIVEMAEQGGDGDVNGDGAVNIADVNQVINTILSGNQNGKGDVNSDGVVNISDVNLIINYILTH